MMRIAPFALLVLLNIAAPLSLRTQPVPSPKREVRAVWITTAASLDWPKSTDPAGQQQSLREMVLRLKASHFNTIFFQVRARGDAYYQSSYEPWASNLTGTLGMNPGWDPLAFLLEEAHRAGLEVHAWFNLYKIWSGKFPPVSTPLHPARSLSRFTVADNADIWLDPGSPEVRAYLMRVAMELVRRYDIDGMHFDFIRYPGPDFRDDDTYRRYGNGQDRDNWRRANIDGFVSMFYDSATTLKPMLKVGSAPIGVYDIDPDNNTRGAYYTLYQDSQGWLKSRTHDYLVPQIYWDIGASRRDPDFAILAKRWQEGSWGRQVYIGIAAYKPEVMDELGRQIDLVRNLGAAGESFFRYEHISTFTMFGRRFSTPALVPPMPWKDSIPPLPPGTLAVTEVSPRAFYLEWQAPERASDGDAARKYAIYRSLRPSFSPDTPGALVNVTAGSETFAVDTVTTQPGLTYYYRVTALDKGNNESPPSAISTVVVREGLALGGKLSNITTVTALVPKDTLAPALVAYKLAARMPVVLEVIGNGDSTGVVRKVQEGGTYVIALPRERFAAGGYLVRLKAGDTIVEQPLMLR